MENLQLGELQVDIVYKALYLLAKQNNIELPEEVELVAAHVSERDPYGTDLVDIVDILELMTAHVKTNEDYDFDEEEN